MQSQKLKGAQTMITNELQLKDFVQREVYYCVSSLIHELSHNEKYMDDILEFSVQYEIDSDDPIEAYEHWIVSDWLAKKLEAKGEMVTLDFYGLTIWGRTCTGQQILCDSVIQDIYEELIK